MDSLEFFATHPVFTHAEFLSSRQGGRARSPRTADNLLRQHEARGRIVRVRRGLYASVPPGVDASMLQVDPFVLATKVSADATVAYHAALEFYGRAYSVWSQVTFLARASIRPFHFGGIAFVPVKPPRSLLTHPELGGGIVVEPHGGGRVRVTTRERTLVDVLDVPELGGGWEEIWRSLERIEFFDLDAVVAYALRLGTALTVARVGFFLEQHRELLFVEDHHLRELERVAPRQRRYFDSKRSPGLPVPRWNLIVPEALIHQRWAEVV